MRKEWRFSAGPEDVSLAAFGTAGLYHATAALMNGAAQTVMIASGVNATHPATIHAWRSDGTVKILVGNLEGAYCAGTPIPGQVAKKADALSTFLNAKMIILPRQARDNHSENL